MQSPIHFGRGGQTVTKPRKALTPYKALAKIADLLGWDGCAAVLDKSESILRKWGDPDAEREMSLQAAIRLDAAYMRAGGGSAPLFECYAARLDLDAHDGPEKTHLLKATGSAAKETGEAVAAALEAASRANDGATMDRAMDEAKEGIESLHALLFTLQRAKLQPR